MAKRLWTAAERHGKRVADAFGGQVAVGGSYDTPNTICSIAKYIARPTMNRTIRRVQKGKRARRSAFDPARPRNSQYAAAKLYR